MMKKIRFDYNKRISDCLQDIDTSGLFTKYTQGFPWGLEYNEELAKALDERVYYDYYARILNRRTQALLNENNLISDEDKKKIMDNFGDFYKVNLKHTFDILAMEYNPIHNFDRNEEINRTVNGEMKKETTTNETVNSDRVKDSTNTTNASMTNEGTNTSSASNEAHLSGSNNGSSTNQVSAFNSSDWSNNEKNSDSTTNTQDNTGSSTQNLTNKNSGKSEQKDVYNEVNNDTNTTNGTVNDSGTNKETETASNHLFGNIGVTTTQQMLDSEVAFWSDFDSYKRLLDCFVDYICLKIY